MRIFPKRYIQMATVSVLGLILGSGNATAGEARRSDVLQQSPAGKKQLADEDAVEKYRREIAAAPRDARLQIGLAKLLVERARFPEAIEAYLRALALRPDSENIELALAETYRQVHNDDEARRILQLARRQHPQSVEVLRATGSLEVDAQAYDAAIQALQAALKGAPTNNAIKNLLAAAYLGKGDSHGALRELDSVLGQDANDGLALFLRAGIHADAGGNEKARSDAGKVVAARPDYLPGRILNAKILVRLKECQRAAAILRPPAGPAIALDGDGLFLLASAYECAGEKELAERVRAQFETASRAEHERSENRVQSLHLVEQANTLAMQNKLTEAQELLQEALEKNPDNGFAYSQQAKIYFSLRQNSQARTAIEKALQLQPYQPDFLYVRGVIEERDGNLDAAMTALRSVTLVNPREADAYFEIGKIWLLKNDRAQALNAFKKAAELEPDDSDYREALRTTSEPHP
ncbi:MAG: tetratricopeptide repeat protein [Candidatus Acidiferrum sp.]